LQKGGVLYPRYSVSLAVASVTMLEEWRPPTCNASVVPGGFKDGPIGADGRPRRGSCRGRSPLS